MIPGELRIFNGTTLQFKRKLDQYLQTIPDQPYLEGTAPGIVDLEGRPSNSLVDWLRKYGNNANNITTQSV